APCGCFFDPRVFHIQWTSTNLPPSATITLGHGTASLPGPALCGPMVYGMPLALAAPGTPQGQPQQFPPYNCQGRTMATDPQVVPTSSPGYQHTEGQSAQINISGTDTPTTASLGSNIPPGSNVPTSPCATPDNQTLGDLASDLAVPDNVLLEEALSLFGWSLDTAGVSQDSPAYGPMPGDPG
ncbi:hypothetical protein Y956_03627, partial [Nipponia nippon]